MGSAVGASDVGAIVGAFVAMQLLVLVGSVTKPSRHRHSSTKLPDAAVQTVLVVSQPCDPSSHACSVGRCVGAGVGAAVGVFEGVCVGGCEGVAVGASVVGTPVGSNVGAPVFLVGVDVGMKVGFSEGKKVGDLVGACVGPFVGASVAKQLVILSGSVT